MSKSKTVTLTSPDGKRTTKVTDPTAVNRLRSQGWKVVEEPKRSPAPAPAPKSEDKA